MTDSPLQQEQSRLRKISALSRGRPEQVFQLSPNDVLVQIALPLVLILAIATRLLMASSQQGPAVMDLWQQYLIMRMDAVSDHWERNAGLNQFPTAQRIQWDGPWPADAAFARLSQESLPLSDPTTMAAALLDQALQYEPEDGGSGEANLSYMDLVSHYPSMELDAARRQFALSHLGKRIQRWHLQMEELQWSVVATCVASLPAGDPHLASDPGAQMHRLSRTLEERGYPLLPSVREEYGEGME